tara:strand:+ start:420 stop:830 length:411 start_codon:yes stop_codon:yes gene_type:complete
MNQTSFLKNKTALELSGVIKDGSSQEFYSFFGNPKNIDYILSANLSEDKKNRLVKKNQVAEKIDYEITIVYDLYYKTKNCRVISKNIVTKFSFVPKSFGYNFGTDRSFEKLYTNSIKKNIYSFLQFFSQSNKTSCN